MRGHWDFQFCGLRHFFTSVFQFLYTGIFVFAFGDYCSLWFALFRSWFWTKIKSGVAFQCGLVFFRFLLGKYVPLYNFNRTHIFSDFSDGFHPNLFQFCSFLLNLLIQFWGFLCTPMPPSYFKESSEMVSQSKANYYLDQFTVSL